MSTFSRKFLIAAFLIGGSAFAFAQQPLPLGSLEVSGRVKIEGKLEKLQRKRFYLFRGGLEENKTLVDRLKAAETVSRDCYYSRMKASSQFICWLKEESCESPYCRQISDSDIKIVPEFKTAFEKGLSQFGQNRASLARDWLTTNLPPVLREGFYRERESLLEKLLNKIQPLQSSMTDSVSVKAIFIDIPLDSANDSEGKKKLDTFLVSNLLPMEIGSKSYLWACEVEISAEKQARLILKVPDDGKPVRDCEVIVKDLPVCKTENCKK